MSLLLAGPRQRRVAGAALIVAGLAAAAWVVFGSPHSWAGSGPQLLRATLATLAACGVVAGTRLLAGVDSGPDAGEAAANAETDIPPHDGDAR